MGRYGIKDVFLTLQGEGARAGTKAVFVRFTGCNLWSGSPLHRDQGVGACAKWCDTDFFKGTAMGTDDLLAKMGELWREDGGERWCVLTGGEPCLQIDRDLMAALHNNGWRIAVESNGSVENDAVLDADWICIAPKLDSKGDPIPFALPRAHELKVVLPGAAPGELGWSLAAMAALEIIARDLGNPALFVQPQDPLVAQNFVEETALKRKVDVEADREAELELQFSRSVQRCVAWVVAHPNWRMSLQMHKFMGMP